MRLTSNRSLVDMRPQTAGELEFDSLEGFPCGCVALVQRARPWPVTVVSIEVQGPHCVLPDHRPGSVVRLGNVWEAGEEPSDIDEDE